MLIWGVALVLLGLVLLVPAFLAWQQVHRLRRTGCRVIGEVTDVDYRGYYSFKMTRPIASYTIDTQSHEAIIGNWIGKAELHTSIDLLVDPEAFSEAVAERSNSAASSVATYFAIVIVGIIVCLLSL